MLSLERPVRHSISHRRLQALHRRDAYHRSRIRRPWRRSRKDPWRRDGCSRATDGAENARRVVRAAAALKMMAYAVGGQAMIDGCPGGVDLRKVHARARHLVGTSASALARYIEACKITVIT